MIFGICPNGIYNLIGGWYPHVSNNYRTLKWNYVVPTTTYFEQIGR